MTIKIPIPQNLESLYTRAATDAKTHNIQWTGDLHQGYGSGFGFEGKYVVDENFITITVLKKPLFATKTRIENEVRRYVGLE